MAENVEAVNPDWEPECVEFFNDLASQDLFLTYAVKGFVDGIVKVAKSSPYEYIVVSGTPSEDLDDNGRKEINAGNTITDTRLVNRRVTLVNTPTATRNSSAFTKPTASDTLTMTSLDTWAVGDIVTIFTR